MNNYINYYYHLYPKEIYQHPNFFYFKLQNDFYYFIPYNRPLLEIGPLYELTIRMLNINSLTHEIILNYLSQPVSFIDNKPYILFKRRLKEDKNLSLKDIIFFNQVHTNIQTNNLLNRSNWGELWSKKIDYFEEQISQVGKNYPLVRESINYFIGLAENAIAYINNTLNEQLIIESLSVAHKRIKKNYTLFDLYNPLTYIIDYQVRDIGEYIKESFFHDKNVWLELKEYLLENQLSTFSLQLLYARLLYPSYYFDKYEEIIEGNLKEESLLIILKKVDAYELFLDTYYNYIINKTLIPPIPWLNKTTYNLD